MLPAGAWKAVAGVLHEAAAKLATITAGLERAISLFLVQKKGMEMKEA